MEEFEFEFDSGENYSFAFLGYLVNEDGVQYGDVYDKTQLDFFQKEEIRCRYSDSVWDQIHFMSPEEFNMENGR